MSILQSITGIVVVEIVSADVMEILEHICTNGIHLWDLDYQNELTVRFRITKSSYRKLVNLLSRRDIVVRPIAYEGIYWNLQAFLRRPVLLWGTIFLLCCTLYLPGRVFFVTIEGNSRLPSNQILETAAQLGIKFGASRRFVRSEEIKNGILSAIEELEWAGVTTKGCVAIISVREHPPVDISPSSQGVGDVVALRDGIVLSCDVTQGSGVCYPGQAVEKGQTLIAGIIDHGIAVTSTTAVGEVFATTQHQFSVQSHAKTQIRSLRDSKKVNFSLLIGKKLINFFKGSGISGVTCVKMYSKYVLTLPGGFALPVALVKWTIYPCDLVWEDTSEEDARSLLSNYATRYLEEHMIAGRILRRDEVLMQTDGAYQLTGNYACTEMIGRLQQEQIGVYNGKTD